MYAVLCALFAAVGVAASEDPWFDAGISRYESWPLDGSAKVVDGAGVWRGTETARLMGTAGVRRLQVSAPEGSELWFATEAERPVSSDEVTVRLTTAFSFRELDDAMAAPPASAKCALTVAKVSKDGTAAYFGLAKDPSGATNVWRRLQGAVPVEGGEVALVVGLRTENGVRFVRYTVGETALEDGDGNAWLPIIFTGEAADTVSAVHFCGEGEVAALTGFVQTGGEVRRIALTIPELEHILIKSVTANGFLIEPANGVYLVTPGSVVVVRFAGETGYDLTASAMRFTAGDAAMELPAEGRPEAIFNPKPTDWAGRFRWNLVEELFLRTGGREALAASPWATAYPDENGRFADVDYATINNSTWAAVKGDSAWHLGGHFGHLVYLALANRIEEDPVRTAAIQCGYDYWLSYYATNKSKCSNWWYHQLEIPRAAGEGLALTIQLNDTVVAVL